MSTRQSTPAANPVVLVPANSLKRALSEDPDSDTHPDTKKPKRNLENAPSVKDKKKRKKKKKKTPVVAPHEQPTSSTNVAPAPNPSMLFSATPSPSKSSAKGKGKATSAPPTGVELDVPEPSAVAHETLQTSEAESSSATIARLNDELSAQSGLLKKHDAMLAQLNQSLTCQICLDLLHKPYALAPCGHVACYNCLVTWFTSAPADDQDYFGRLPRKKTCPQCRATIKERPVEVWNIKEMVAALIKGSLVPGLSPAPPPAPALPGPPPSARAQPDPWHNIFRYPHQNPGLHPPGGNGEPPRVEDMGMLDNEDGGVYRCLDCMHEIWDGVCTSCHRVYPGHQQHHLHLDVDGWDEDDEDEEGLLYDGIYDGDAIWHVDDDGDEDDDDDEEPDIAQEFWPHRFFPINAGIEYNGPIALPGWWAAGEDDSDSATEHHGEDGGTEEEEGYDSFIDDGDVDEHEHHHAAAAAIVEIVDSDEDSDSGAPRLRGRGRRAAPRIYEITDDEEDGDEGVVPPTSRSTGTRNRNRVVSSSSEGSEIIVITSDEEDGSDTTLRVRRTAGSRLRSLSDGEHVDENGELHVQEDYGGDEEEEVYYGSGASDLDREEYGEYHEDEGVYYGDGGGGSVSQGSDDEELW